MRYYREETDRINDAALRDIGLIETEDGKVYSRNGRNDDSQAVEPPMELPMADEIAREVAEGHNNREGVLAELLTSHHDRRIRARRAVADQKHHA